MKSGHNYPRMPVFRKFQQKNYVFPFPQTEIDNYLSLEQNDNY
jgi:hypothetical protein